MRKTKPTTKCTKCNRKISNEYYTEHVKSCQGEIDYSKYFVIQNDKYICLICNKEYSKYGIKNHIVTAHLNIPKNKPKGYKPWNKGLTKEDHPSIKQGGLTLKERYKSGEVKHGWLGKTHSEESKQKISKALTKAHADGRAWNIGRSRWNNKPSYPERFFIQVIENEFDNKNYVREYPFFKYSLDFAWVTEKLCIEIDGEQHYRFSEYKARDEAKDKLLVENGWKLLRLRWIEVFKEPKKYIKLAKQFINNNN